MYLFDNGSGVTADSLRYYRDNRHQLAQIVEAHVHYPGRGGPYPYCFELRDDADNHMWLSGLTTGYGGEGPRAAVQVLIDVGFTATAARLALYEEQLHLGPADLAEPLLRWTDRLDSDLSLGVQLPEQGRSR